MFDVNVYQENIYHTKMHLKDFDLDRYLFEEKARNLSFKERMKIEALIKREIEELFHGRNLVASGRRLHPVPGAGGKLVTGNKAGRPACGDFPHTKTDGWPGRRLRAAFSFEEE